MSYDGRKKKELEFMNLGLFLRRIGRTAGVAMNFGKRDFEVGKQVIIYVGRRCVSFVPARTSSLFVIFSKSV
jgi:hypothetical protein